MTRYYENGDITTKVQYIPVGHGRNAETVYKKHITVFSIANGIIKDEIIPCKVFYR